jgi:hypothetical protein
MPRPKKTNYDDEIINVDMQIEKYEASLRALYNTRKQLVEQKEKVEINMLHDTIKKSGRSVQDIIQALEQISQRKVAIQPTPVTATPLGAQLPIDEGLDDLDESK